MSKIAQIEYALLILYLSLCCQVHGQVKTDYFGVQFISHSHNDYQQKYPLTTALANNFGSIEIDIVEHNGRIIVSHDDKHLDQKPTIQELYLNRIFSAEYKSVELILLLDIKSTQSQILDVLHATITKYSHELKSIHHPSKHGRIQLILSGNVPKGELLATDDYPFFYVDGRINDLESNYISPRIAMISADFGDLSNWKGRGKICHKKLHKIIDLVTRSKEKGKMVRFWNTPETHKAWKLLIGLRVDVIGVDHINRFVDFLDGV